jgi:hypothetical protein
MFTESEKCSLKDSLLKVTVTLVIVYGSELEIQYMQPQRLRSYFENNCPHLMLK